MSKLIHTSFEIGYKESGALDYFHDVTSNKYLDKNRYKVVSTRGKEITDDLDISLGLKDYEWRIEVYDELKKLKEQPNE